MCTAHAHIGKSGVMAADSDAFGRGLVIGMNSVAS